ncbi:SRPBCC family protein [Flavobacterium sp. JP2137]|uniref:SRPBCC family protein n=1 Tax=Flavobacterium sp. JP2137 TaxID=3414510 RepID=UPI003D2FF3E5
MKIETQIIIAAPPETVWRILTDFQRYPQWNPFIKSLSGAVAVGNTIKIELPDMTFSPKVLVFDENRELQWRGKLLIKGLFDGEHRFVLEALPDGATRFLHSETFSGCLVPLFKNKLINDTTKGFEAMNSQLKSIAESN